MDHGQEQEQEQEQEWSRRRSKPKPYMITDFTSGRSVSLNLPSHPNDYTVSIQPCSPSPSPSTGTRGQRLRPLRLVSRARISLEFRNLLIGQLALCLAFVFATSVITVGAFFAGRCTLCSCTLDGISCKPFLCCNLLLYHPTVRSPTRCGTLPLNRRNR